MKKTIFTGAGVALVTPMNEDGSVNYEMLGKLIDFQIENSTDAIIVCATSGESATLTHEEHKKAVKFSVDRVAHRVPVIAGTGSNNTAVALELSLEAEKCGADALLIVTPYYNKTTQSGIVRHYTYIADRVNTPIIVYNVPSRTGLNILPSTYLELSKHPNIVAIKEANGNLAAVAETMALCGDNIDVYSGEDTEIVAICALGGKGVISVLSNIMPKETHDMCAKVFAGDLKGAAKLQFDTMGLVKALFCETSPIPAKKALQLMGYEVGECRMPLAPMLPENIGHLKKELSKLGLIA